MYLALREIRSAAGRFVLIGSVTTLITLLLVMLTGLTDGLGNRNTSGLESLEADRIAFIDPATQPAEVNFDNSAISGEALAALRRAAGPGVEVTPLGVGQIRAQSSAGAIPVGVFGLPLSTSVGESSVGDGAVISHSVAENLSLQAGDTVTIGSQSLRVDAVVEDQFYNHSPVVWINTSAWQAITHTTDLGTVGLLHTHAPGQDFQEISADTGATIVSTQESLEGLASYSSERGSLVSMQGFLYAISALVTISFLSVWTMQRTRDIAVLRCLGASTSYIFKDALTQAAIVVALGTSSGALLGYVFGSLLARTSVPFLLSPHTVVVPAVGVFVLGVIGAALAVRRVSKVDPLQALAATS